VEWLSVLLGPFTVCAARRRLNVMLIEHFKALVFIVVFVLVFDGIRYSRPFRRFIKKQRQNQDAVIKVKPEGKLGPDDPRLQEYMN
jgi:hypothetical protein